MNRGTRMSSALALVTPRAVVNPDAPPDAVLPDAALPRAADKTLHIVAKVPDLRPASGAAAEPAKASWKPSWTLPRPKFRVAYLRVAAMMAGLDFATCWTWIITLPPIVKLGTVMASLVMSIWMFSDNEEVTVEPAPTSAWHEQETTPRLQVAADASTAAQSPDDKAPADSTPSGDSIDEAVRLARDSARSEQPTIREIQEAARGASKSPSFDEGWPRGREDDGAIARATVRPIPSHKEPHTAAMPYDASPRRDYSNRDDARAGGPVVGVPVEEQPFDNGPEPPTDMPRRWAERPQPTETAGYPPVQTNPHYADTAVARTPSRTVDRRANDNRPTYENRPAYADERSADPRYADNRFASQPTPEQLEAERRAYEANRQRAYQFSRDRAQADRYHEPETYRR